jgi:hypothetical protein
MQRVLALYLVKILMVNARIIEIEVEIEIPMWAALVEKIDAERLAEPVIYRPICETSFGISCIVILKWS